MFTAPKRSLFTSVCKVSCHQLTSTTGLSWIIMDYQYSLHMSQITGLNRVTKRSKRTLTSSTTPSGSCQQNVHGILFHGDGTLRCFGIDGYSCSRLFKAKQPIYAYILFVALFESNYIGCSPGYFIALSHSMRSFGPILINSRIVVYLQLSCNFTRL